MSTKDLDLESCALLTGETVESAANDSVTVRTRTKQRISLNSKRRRSRMSRRANLIGICGVSSLCILLLIATTQHRPLTSPFSSGSSSSSSGSSNINNAAVASSLMSNNLARNGGYYERQQQASQTAATIYNMTATIVDVLICIRCITNAIAGSSYHDPNDVHPTNATFGQFIQLYAGNGRFSNTFNAGNL